MHLAELTITCLSGLRKGDNVYETCGRCECHPHYVSTKIFYDDADDAYINEHAPDKHVRPMQMESCQVSSWVIYAMVWHYNTKVWFQNGPSSEYLEILRQQGNATCHKHAIHAS